MGDHRKLEVWQLACTLADRVYELVSHLPPRVRKQLGDQLERAADSIHMNIAEGCGLNSDKQLARCIDIALGSANEVESVLMRLEQRGLLPSEYADMIEAATLLRRKLGALLKRVRKDADER